MFDWKIFNSLLVNNTHELYLDSYGAEQLVKVMKKLQFYK